MFQQKLHWAVFACGVALLAVTAVGAALGWHSTGLWILGILGVICLLMALVAHRLRNVTVEHGDVKIGFTLDAEVREDLTVTGLTGAAGTYSFIHNQLAKDPGLAEVKTKLQDQVVDMVRANAFIKPVGEKEVERVLTSGSPAERVLVFGLLEGDGKLVTVERLRKGIMESKSGNEQYHALRATQMHWSTFSPDEKEKLRGYVKDAPYIKEDRDRTNVADEILAAGR